MKPEALHRTKRFVYVVLLVVALMASGYVFYRQITSENTVQDLASQVNTACTQDPVGSAAKGLNCAQARSESPAGTVTLPPPPPVVQMIPGPTTYVPLPPVTVPSIVQVPVPTVVPGPTRTETRATTETKTETQTETETVTEPPPPTSDPPTVTTTTEPPVTTTTSEPPPTSLTEFLSRLLE